MSGAEVPSGVARHRFELRSREEIVPGYLWTATDGHGRRPLVLLGHGATASKDTPRVTALAMRLVAELGYAAAAIDFPNHGERRPEEERPVPAAQVRSAMGLVAWRQRNTRATEQAICDLRARSRLRVRAERRQPGPCRIRRAVDGNSVRRPVRGGRTPGEGGRVRALRLVGGSAPAGRGGSGRTIAGVRSGREDRPGASPVPAPVGRRAVPQARRSHALRPAGLAGEDPARQPWRAHRAATEPR